jgi:hypothetical protein
MGTDPKMTEKKGGETRKKPKRKRPRGDRSESAQRVRLSKKGTDPKRGAAGSKRAVPTKGQKGLVGEGAKRIVVSKKGTDPHKWKQRFQRGTDPEI